MKKIFFIQDLATPHNNRLIRHLRMSFEGGVFPYYSTEKYTLKFNWLKNKIPDNIQIPLTYEFPQTKIYGSNFCSEFLWKMIKNYKDIIILVGWININTLLLHIIFFFLQKKYVHLTDYAPNYVNKNFIKKIKTFISHNLLKYSKCLIVTTSNDGLNYFKKLVKNDERVFLQKLPWINISQIKENKTNFKNLAIVNKHKSKFIISCGSRLIREKGYDLLLNSVSQLEKKYKNQLIIFIAGSGEEFDNLKNLVKSNNLENICFFLGWLEDLEFSTLIYRSDLFVHTARKDAYGSTNIALNLGIPVFGSINAGSAVDNIENYVNGMTYNPENISELSNLIKLILTDDKFRVQITKGAYKRAIINDASYNLNDFNNKLVKYFN